MPTELQDAIDRFLGGAPVGSLRVNAVRKMAHSVIDAWREGRVTTAQALRALADGLEAMHAAEHGHLGVA
jgi:hypothetical protein